MDQHNKQSYDSKNKPNIPKISLCNQYAKQQ